MSWDKTTGTWRAYINKDNTRYELGHYKNKNDAIISRLNGEVKYFEEYAPQKYLFKQYGIKG